MTGRVSLYARLICPLLVLFSVGVCAVAAQPDEFIARGTVCEDKSNGPQLWVGADGLMLPPGCDGVDVVGWDWSEVKGAHKFGGTRWGDFVVIGNYDHAQNEMALTRPAIPAMEYKGSGLDQQYAEDSSITPCKKPRGGWRVLDPDSTTQQSLEDTVELVESRRDYGSLWVDQSLNPVTEIRTEEDELAMNDPTKLILNVSVTGDPAKAEADIRKSWGGALCVSRQKYTARQLGKIQDAVSTRPEMLMAGGSDDFVELLVVWDDGSLQSELDEQYGRGMVRVISAIRPLKEDLPRSR